MNHKARIVILWKHKRDKEPCKVLVTNRITWEVSRILGVYRYRWTGTEMAVHSAETRDASHRDVLWNSGRGAKRDKDVDGERLVAENAKLRRRNAELSRRNDELSRRVAEPERLMKKLGGEPFTERQDLVYSLKAEERRQAGPEGSGTRKRQRSLRRGRVTTQEKLARADRTQTVLPSLRSGSVTPLKSRTPTTGKWRTRTSNWPPRLPRAARCEIRCSRRRNRSATPRKA